MIEQNNRVLVVGATGFLGGKVVDVLLNRGKTVHAMVRPGSDAAALEAKGVKVVRGDMLDRASLPHALDGIDALVTTAIGYSRRRKGDSAHTDDQGNRNLVDAAKQAGLGRFVFTGVLNAHMAPQVSHFYQKVLIEDYLETSGVPFVSIRPPGFIDQVLMPDAVRKGRLISPFDPNAKASVILAADAARYLALAVDEPRALNQRIAVAADMPASFNDITAILSRLTKRTIRVQSPPQAMMKVMMPLAGLFSPIMRDMPAMIAFIASGSYIGDLTLQRQLFDVPTTEDTLLRWLEAHELLTHVSSA